ncbi:hypothetical protein ACI65C_006311 [Semiaphis heraclei]
MSSESDEQEDILRAPHGQAAGKLGHKKQKFRKEWLSINIFKNWLQPLWSLVELFRNSDDANKGATAIHIYTEVINSFISENVPLNNIIGFASDGCNTMMGSWNSVSSNFKNDLPGIFIQKCICHSLALCASESCKVLPRKNEQRLIMADTIFDSLHDPLVLLNFKFLEWVLPKFTTMNELFQSEKSEIAILHSKMEEIYKELLYSYMKRVDDPFQIDPNNQKFFLLPHSQYLGLGVLKIISDPSFNISKETLDYFYVTCRQFLIISCQQIKKRIVSFYNAEELQNIDSQWRKLENFELSDTVKALDDTEDFWVSLYQLQINGEYPFKCVSEFILRTLSLPHSSADCEQVFSKVNLIKTKMRNKLGLESMNGLLLSSQCMKETSCIDFEPTKKMIDSMNLSMYEKEDVNIEKRPDIDEHNEENDMSLFLL